MHSSQLNKQENVMKIAIPSNDGTRMAVHTGRALGFIVYQVFGQTAERLDYRAISEQNLAHTERCFLPDYKENHDCSFDICSRHTTEPVVMHDLIDDCDVLLSVGIGPNLGRTLSNSPIEMVYCQEEIADDAAREFALGTLPIFDFSRCILTEEDLKDTDLNLATA